LGNTFNIVCIKIPTGLFSKFIWERKELRIANVHWQNDGLRRVAVRDVKTGSKAEVVWQWL
jgi:hypothetical protein